MTDALVSRAFKLVGTTFAIAALATGLQALFLPTTFAQSFGLPIQKLSDDPDVSVSTVHGSSYVSLMGVRQLATGIILLVFAYQGKWADMATILSIIGVLVAGTDGVFLAKAGRWKEARFHAIPGAGIATLAVAFLLKGE